MESSFLSRGSAGSSFPSSSSAASPRGPHSLVLINPTLTAECIPPPSPSHTVADPRQHSLDGGLTPKYVALPAVPAHRGEWRAAGSEGRGSLLCKTDHGGPTPLGSCTAISLSDSAVAAGCCGGVSASAISLPTVTETVPQPPPASLRRRMSAIAPITLTAALEVDKGHSRRRFPSLTAASPAAAAVAAVALGASSRRDNSSKSGSSRHRDGGDSSGPTGLDTAALNITTNSNTTMFTTQRSHNTVYASYNVHPVVCRSVHPLFQRDIPVRLGRQTNISSTSTLFPMFASQVRTPSPARGATTVSPGSSMAGVGGVSVAMAGVDGTSRRGFRFPQVPLPQKAAEVLDAPLRLDRVSPRSQTNSGLVEFLSSATHSTADQAPTSLADRHGVLAPTPTDVPHTCVTPSLEPAATASQSSSENYLPPSTSFSCSRQPRETTTTITTAKAAGGASSSSSSALQSTPSLTFAATWTSRGGQPPPSSLQGAGVSLTSSSLLPISAHLRSGRQLHLAEPLASSATPSTRHQPTTAPRAYSRRDIRRGRWILDMACEECAARAALEEAESFEAIRTLPASWRVWKTYIDPAFNDAYDALGYYLLARAAQSPTRMAMSSNADGYAELLDGLEEEDGDDGDMNTVVEQVRRKLARTHRPLIEESLSSINTSSSTPTHPALFTASRRLALLEEVCREELLRTEAADFTESLYRPYVYERRLLTTATLPLKRTLRRWLSCFRARKILHARQRERLCAAEEDARVGLIVTSSTLAARDACLVAAVVAEELYYRTQIQLLYVQDAAWTGVVLTRLRQHAELFALVYSGTMRQTRVCGRVDQTTLFRSLVLCEGAARDEVVAAEAVEWRLIPTILQVDFAVVSEEPQARVNLYQAEMARRCELTQVIHALTVHYTMSDVKMREYEERMDLRRVLRDPSLSRVRAMASCDEDGETPAVVLCTPTRGASNESQRSIALSL